MAMILILLVTICVNAVLLGVMYATAKLIEKSSYPFRSALFWNIYSVLLIAITGFLFYRIIDNLSKF